MSVRNAVLGTIEHTAAENGIALPPLTDRTVLLDSGLDSLAIAILVARLEDTLGFDPFAASDETEYPVTVGDFVRLYELAAERHGADASSRAGQHA
jgi:acyl carrier protein